MRQFDVNAIREELVQALSRKFDRKKPVAIYGAGGASILAKPCFDQMENIEYFIDDTPGKAGTLFFDRPVISLSEALEKSKSHLILVSCHVQKSRRIMLNKLYEHQITGSEIGTLEEYIYCTNAESILSVYDMLEDDISKATYANVIQVRMGKAPLNPDLVYRGEQYFLLPQFAYGLSFQDVFVDCGAYVGDTLEKYMLFSEGSFKKIFAFEPDERLYQALQIRAERLRKEYGLSDDRLVLINAGVGEKDDNVSFHRDTTAPGLSGTFQNTAFNSQEAALRVFSLDSYFANEKISFIKADIESYEYPMLLGAEKVIKRDKPRIAISIYHNAVDTFRLALKIKEMNSCYKFAIRQHQYVPHDTVLYAYDEENYVNI